VRQVRAIAKHPITGQMIRYGISGVVVTSFYLGMPIVVSDVFGWPLQALIPTALVLAATLQFTLQRRFVFRHVDAFALSVRAQALWYVIIAAIQYPTTALGTFLLPKLFGIPDRVAFIVTSLTFSLFFFLFIRRRVFHASEPARVQERVIVG
jgi:putative flippase GtrA